jgi:hypothetical protein
MIGLTCNIIAMPKVLALKFGYYYLDGEKANPISVSKDIWILA